MKSQSFLIHHSIHSTFSFTATPGFAIHTLCINCKQTRKRRQQRKQRQRESQTRQTLSPAPLLLKPLPQTKTEALTDIINSVESSIENGITIDVELFASLLEACCQLRAIDEGMRLQRLIPKTLLRKNVGLAGKLVKLYALCGDVESAQQLFDEMSKRDSSAFAWNSLISGYAELGQYEDAMAIYFQMEEEGVRPDRFTFPRVLKACGGLGVIRVGERVHRDVIRAGFGNDVFVLNALVDMYAKCGDIEKAKRVFDKIACRDLVSWNSMLTGYIRHGLLMDALEIFREMLKGGIKPDSFALSKIVTGLMSLKVGVQIHGWVIRHGNEWSLSVANALIVLYSKHGKLDRARWLFERMPKRDVVSWNAIVSAYSKSPEALTYFKQVENAGVVPDCITFVSVLSTCAHLSLVEDGERLFSVMRDKYGMKPSNEHYACMVNLYGRAGLIDKAFEMIVKKMEFDAGPTVWGALLYACYLHGNVAIGELAAERLFELEPDNGHNFELLMKIYSNAGKTDDVERVRKMMMDRGLR